MAKLKGFEVSTSLKDERGARASVIVCDQGEEPLRFWEALGGKGAVAPAEPEALAPELQQGGVATLKKATVNSGELRMTDEGVGNLSSEMLDTKGVFILDNEAEARLQRLQACRSTSAPLLSAHFTAGHTQASNASAGA